MLTDPFDQQLTDLLRAARPLPPPGWRSQALAALAGVRPRRHPNLLTYIIVAALILLLAAGLFAAVRYVLYIEGVLQAHDALDWGAEERGGYNLQVHSFSGTSESVGPLTHIRTADVSPDGERVAFVRAEPGWRPESVHILVSPADRSADIWTPVPEEVNLTEVAGIGGFNCQPKWSPDGTMIAFAHFQPVEGLRPCESRPDRHLWVMNSDGTDAHRVTPDGSPPITSHAWSPDGSRLLISAYESIVHSTGFAISTDIWGTDIQVLPNVGDSAVWSPDGSMIASVWREEGEVDGELGRWNRLRLTNADGSRPQVLVEQFVAYAEVEGRYPTDEMLKKNPHLDWVAGVISYAGPTDPVWSPSGDKIAFLAAMPFDVEGTWYMDQNEVWVYDLAADRLVRLTHDDVRQYALTWK